MNYILEIKLKKNQYNNLYKILLLILSSNIYFYILLKTFHNFYYIQLKLCKLLNHFIILQS